MPMTRAELQSLHEKMCSEARATQTKKNHDYASEADIFRNFRYFGGLGILVRMSDKLARLRSFEENGVFKVEDEKLADTVQDLINYAIIYYAFKHADDPTQPAPPIAAALKSFGFDIPADSTVTGVTVSVDPAFTVPKDQPYMGTPGLGGAKIESGPYCDHCEKLATWRLDGNHCETRFFCDSHTIYLERNEYDNCTRLETL